MTHVLATHAEAFKILLTIIKIIALIVIIAITFKLFYSKFHLRPGYIASNDYVNEYPEVTVDNSTVNVNMQTTDYKHRISNLLANAKFTSNYKILKNIYICLKNFKINNILAN